MSASRRLDVRVRERLDELDPREWRALTARPPASLIGSRAWVTAAFETVDRDADPYLVSVEEDGRLVGLLPLALRERNGLSTLTFPGDPHNDMTDLIALPGRGRTAARAALAALAFAPPDWAISLDALDPHGSLAAADGELGVLRWAPGDPAPALDLRGSPAAGVPARRRRRWDRDRRLLEAGRWTEVGWIEGADAVAALPDFVRRRERRLRARRRPLDLPPIPLLESVVRRLAPAGGCALIELRVDGEPAATDLYLLDRPVAMAWLRALDARWLRFSCGHLLLRATAERLAADGYEVLDLGRGDEPYKGRHGASARTLLRATRNARPTQATGHGGPAADQVGSAVSRSGRRHA
jgi:CelD/BcsL family acetyltransferase involved in cellulose biosynthesis